MAEEIGISLCEQARIGGGRRAAEMDRSGEGLRQMRFELPQLRPRKHRIVDAVFLERLRVRDTLEQSLLCAAAIEPTSMVHEALSRTADLGNQRVMLLDALRHQRGERSH